LRLLVGRPESQRPKLLAVDPEEVGRGSLHEGGGGGRRRQRENEGEEHGDGHGPYPARACARRKCMGPRRVVRVDQLRRLQYRRVGQAGPSRRPERIPCSFPGFWWAVRAPVQLCVTHYPTTP